MTTSWPEKLSEGICEEGDCEHKSCEVAFDLIKESKQLVFELGVEDDAIEIDDSDFESVPPSEPPYQRASHGHTPIPAPPDLEFAARCRTYSTGPVWTHAAGTYATGQKPTNPKDAVGSDKLPLHLWPETATAMGSLGLLDGMLKYGRSNFRAIGVRATIYTDAAKRHINAWLEGEDNDPDSGLPHFAHALACLAILVDAGAAGKLNDDRQYPGGYRGLVDSLTPHVARLKAHHAGESPKHYTIADAPNGLEDL